jgi:predicted nucleic-acid-binding protein
VRGLDTNVLVRYLTQDAPAQSRKANAAIAAVTAAGDRCFVDLIVLCELTWVLRGAYGAKKSEVVAVLDALLVTPQLVLEERALVRAALEEFRRGPADFADYLLGHVNSEAGCDQTATFDRRLKKSALFVVL